MCSRVFCRACSPSRPLNGAFPERTLQLPVPPHPFPLPAGEREGVIHPFPRSEHLCEHLWKRCLIIADDLTGGADTGAQFAKNGLSTFLISFGENHPIDFSKYGRRDVLVINTDSRGLKPGKAFQLVSNLLKNFDPDIFPVIYKKIDSTLRGNIGYEIDALIQETNRSLCFMAPSYPEQSRTVVYGILRVEGKLLASTEISRDTTFPVQESHVCRLLEHQSRHPIGAIDVKHVASGGEVLLSRVAEESEKGNRIIVFDAENRQDLTNIVEAAFRMERMPLLVGSAGLAREVAKKIFFSKSGLSHISAKGSKPFKHIFIISGSASSVTHRQLKQLQKKNVPEFILNPSWLTREILPEIEKREFSNRIASALSERCAVLKAPIEPLPKDLIGLPVHLKITKSLASLALSAMEESGVTPHEIALILTGGEMAMSLIRLLQAEGIEIEGELLEGIMRGHLTGGKWDGMTVVTKAGAFGNESALKNIVEILEMS